MNLVDFQEISSLRIDRSANLPIAAQLSEHLTWLIASGVLQRDQRLPAVRELARKLNIHMHTVRSAYQTLETRGLITMRQGRGSDGRGYQDATSLERTSTIQTNSIGVLIPGYNLFFLPLLTGIEEAARKRNSMLFIGHTNNDGHRASGYVNQFSAKNVDGAIIVSSWDEKSAPRDIPAVYLDIPGAPGPSILFNSEKAGYEAGHHLIQHGHDRIGLITSPIEWPNVKQVFKGYTRALMSENISVDKENIVIVPDFSIETGYKAAKELFSRDNPPSALFAISDQQAIGAMRAMQEMGIAVPEDVAVIGYNDVEIAAFVDPPLTTVSAPAYQMGFEAMQLLGRIIEDQNENHQIVVLDTKLILRKSCGCE